MNGLIWRTNFRVGTNSDLLDSQEYILHYVKEIEKKHVRN